MSEEQRYEILKDQKIVVSADEDSSNYKNDIERLEDLLVKSILNSEFIDGADLKSYNEITIPAEKYNHLLSEAMTRDADKVNQLCYCYLDGIRYQYYFDNDHNLHIISAEVSKNIHEKENIYDGIKSDGKKPDTIISESGYPQGDGNRRWGFSENRGKDGTGFGDNYRSVSTQREGNRSGRQKNRSVSYGKEKRKLIRFHDNEGGMVILG